MNGSKVQNKAEEKGLASTISEESLLFRDFLEGSDKAFGTLFKRYNGKLTLYAIKFTNDRNLAEDIVQGVWEKVIHLRSREDLRAKSEEAVEVKSDSGSDRKNEEESNISPIRHPAAFLFRITHNSCLDALRGRKEHTSLDGLHEGEHPATPEEQPENELQDIVTQSLEKLSHDHKEVLVMQLYLGYQLGEIAEILGKSRDAIWARASRARTELRRIVAREMEKRHYEISPSFAQGFRDKANRNGKAAYPVNLAMAANGTNSLPSSLNAPQ